MSNMHEEMDQELERSTIALQGRGREVKPDGETNDGVVEVGSAHSSPRSGKLATWRRG